MAHSINLEAKRQSKRIMQSMEISLEEISLELKDGIIQTVICMMMSASAFRKNRTKSGNSEVMHEIEVLQA